MGRGTSRRLAQSADASSQIPPFCQTELRKITFHGSGPGYFGVGYDELKIMAFKTDKVIAVVEPLVTSNTF